MGCNALSCWAQSPVTSITRLSCYTDWKFSRGEHTKTAWEKTVRSWDWKGRVDLKFNFKKKPLLQLNYLKLMGIFQICASHQSSTVQQRPQFVFDKVWHLFTEHSAQLQEYASSVAHAAKKVLPLKAGLNSFWTKQQKMASYVK